MNCDKTLELLSAELDGRLSEAEHAELQAHLDECADCRRVYGTLRMWTRCCPRRSWSRRRHCMTR